MTANLKICLIALRRAGELLKQIPTKATQSLPNAVFDGPVKNGRTAKVPNGQDYGRSVDIDGPVKTGRTVGLPNDQETGHIVQIQKLTAASIIHERKRHAKADTRVGLGRTVVFLIVRENGGAV